MALAPHVRGMPCITSGACTLSSIFVFFCFRASVVLFHVVLFLTTHFPRFLLFFTRAGCVFIGGRGKQVVCGRGGSATTRYVDLVVGMEAGEYEKESTREFSNIEREDLPSLQVNLQSHRAY